MVVGTIVSIVWEVAGLATTLGIHTFFAGVVISAVVFIIGSLIGKPPAQEIQDAMDRAACKTKIPAGFATADFKELAPETSGVISFLKESDYMEERGFMPV